MRKRSKKYTPPPKQEKQLFPELKAAQLLEQGEIQQALQIAIRALASGRRNPDLSNIAGVCAAASGDNALAAQLWQHAVEISPAYAQGWFNLGLWHEKHQRLAEAETHYQQAVLFDPANLEALLLLSELLMGRNENSQAEPHLRKALELVPEHPQANNSLGLILASRRQFAEAEQCYLKVLETEPDNPQALTNYGLLLEQLQRPLQAEECHRKALAGGPDSTEILSNLANLLSAQRRESEAEPLFQQALQINADAAAVHTNLGVLLANMHRDNEAEHHFKCALSIKPDYLLPRLNLSYLQLSQGRFADGWRNHETRHHPRLPGNGVPQLSATIPQWQGEDINGKSLLVWAEQGYGDQIQFARYIPLIKQRWNVRITLVCRPALHALFETLDGVDVLLAVDADLRLPEPVDYWTLPLSFPLHCNTLDIASIPASIPYLVADPQRVTHWQAVMTQPKFKVGLVWQGNPRHLNDAWRSLPSPEVLLPLLEVPDVHYYSLQKDWDTMTTPAFFQHAAVTHLGDKIENFADAAAIVSQLDLVICVDTAIAHLAGALGKPCWLMLPHYRTDWRWLQGRADSPWYPTLRMFRQGGDESWEPVILALKRGLAEERPPCL